MRCRVSPPAAQQDPASGLRGFLLSSIGAKIVMAVTGGALFLFVVGHLAGNLQVFAGAEAFNAYAHFLKSKPALVWSARLALLPIFLVHLAAAARLRRVNRAARPVPYAVKATVQATTPSLTMWMSGLTVLVFVVYHLLHFTVGAIQPDHFARVDAQGRHDAYGMLVLGFRHPGVSAFYIAGMVLLGMHLAHGLSSFFQTLGFNHPRYTPAIRRCAALVAALVAVGYIAIPLAVLAGVVALPSGGAP